MRHSGDISAGRVWPCAGQGLSSHSSQCSCGTGRKELRRIPRWGGGQSSLRSGPVATSGLRRKQFPWPRLIAALLSPGAYLSFLVEVVPTS